MSSDLYWRCPGCKGSFPDDEPHRCETATFIPIDPKRIELANLLDRQYDAACASILRGETRSQTVDMLMRDFEMGKDEAQALRHSTSKFLREKR